MIYKNFYFIQLEMKKCFLLLLVVHVVCKLFMPIECFLGQSINKPAAAEEKGDFLNNFVNNSYHVKIVNQ